MREPTIRAEGLRPEKTSQQLELSLRFELIKTICGRLATDFVVSGAEAEIGN